MSKGFLLAIKQLFLMLYWTVRYLPKGRLQQFPRRLIVFVVAVSALILINILHWLGFALDELFFRRYRKINIEKPVFVTGIPRSGTTHLQRVLAEHDQLTCMKMWECFLAPSISERYLYSFLGYLFKPLSVLIGRMPLSFLKKMDSIHSLGFKEAEEDFVALLPINACFLLVVLFPEVKHYWQLSRFDKSMPPKDRAAVLSYYHRILQKHLCFHGDNKRYLCKNPSFMMWIDSLAKQYPDASFILCEREANKTIPSQLSSLEPTWELVYGEPMSAAFSTRIVSMLASYYHYLNGVSDLDIHAKRLPMKDLVTDLEGSVKACLQHCGLEMTEVFQVSLQQQSQEAQQYRSGHNYGSTEIFDWSDLADQFPSQFLKQTSVGASK